MPAELSTPQVAPFAVTRHWSSQLDDQATTAQSLLGPPATFKDNPGPPYIWRSDDRDRNIGALQPVEGPALPPLRIRNTIVVSERNYCAIPLHVTVSPSLVAKRRLASATTPITADRSPRRAQSIRIELSVGDLMPLRIASTIAARYGESAVITPPPSPMPLGVSSSTKLATA